MKNKIPRQIGMASYHFWLSKYNKEEDKNLIRIGQSFCNHFNITDSDIFYSTDPNVTRRIFDKYVSLHF